MKCKLACPFCDEVVESYNPSMIERELAKHVLWCHTEQHGAWRTITQCPCGTVFSIISDEVGHSARYFMEHCMSDGGYKKHFLKHTIKGM